MVMRAGTIAMAAAISCERVLLKSMFGREMYLDKARHTQTLQNSAGWNWIPPNLMIDSVVIEYNTCNDG